MYEANGKDEERYMEGTVGRVRKAKAKGIYIKKKGRQKDVGRGYEKCGGSESNNV